MRVAVTMIKAEYNTQEQVSIKAIEIVDTTVWGTDASIEFTDSNSSTVYIKKIVDITEDAYKNTIISNYADPVSGGCYYNKTAGTIVPRYTSPNNRNLLTLNTDYPAVSDQFLGTMML